ncbi:cation:proton antiporter [Fulvivirgaceae bacterium BMA10]|uniref:Cation:proton antiporter n=1 Tax=Splendidivirga corallicola TaxID=3051826 RepID=A0ABT8KMN7_9BACT|nr:cation:proton antiporter [Fulvivirgaceae bacterium BMA10]
MEPYQEILIYLIGFLIVTIASMKIARVFLTVKLPLITGMLVMGIIAGPFIGKLIPFEAVTKLGFINDFSLAFIAFAAGAELYLKELRSRLNSIKWMTFGQLVVTFVIGSVVIFLMANYIPFMQSMNTETKVAVAILAGTIFVARSPSSAIAVINEMRAKGPFTQTALGVTVVKDVLVIILFAVCFATAEALVMGKSLRLGFIVLLATEISFSCVSGLIVGKILQLILYLKIHSYIKTVFILGTGYAVYLFSYLIKDLSHQYLPFEVYLEPLLICIIGSFIVTNYTNHRPEFLKILNKIGPRVYAAFFILTGASMSLDILVEVWAIALGLFFVRMVGMVIGSFTGGILAGDPMKYNKIGWMPYVTQAGVSLGLATIVATRFPYWGPQFATVMIAVIVLNQIVGPPLFKWSIQIVGEGRTKANTQAFDGIRDAIIFGLEDQSIALARQLSDNGWEVKIATRMKNFEELGAPQDLDIRYFPNFDLNAFEELDARLAEAMVMMLTDEDNYEICELAYQNLGTKDLVVRLNDRNNFDKFHELNAKIVDPSTAIVSLLDHFVRSPQATSLLLGMEKDQDTIDLEVLSRDLHGITLRELRLPSDIIILSVTRGGQMIISHGFTRLRLGDVVTMVGSSESLRNVSLRFEERLVTIQ